MLDTQDKGPALKADDMGGSAITQAAGQQMRGPEAAPAPAAAAPSPAAVAQKGFSGAGHDVPHRAEMEKSFGMDLGGVRAHTDASAQAASKSLGAHAYALDNHVAFASTTPDKATVAHELTHTIQASGGAAPAGPAKKSVARDAAIDTSGEGEAERVEAAVAAGKPARAALDGGTAKQGGPRLKKRGISRKESGSPMTLGMAFSPEGLEKQYWWNLWNAPEFEVPIPAVPGLNFKISPEVKVLAAGGVNWKEKNLETQLKLEGIVGLGFSYGKSELAEVYAVLEANATGGFDYKYNTGGGEGEHALPEHAGGEHEHAEHEHEEHAAEPGHAMVPAKKEAKRWELSGNIALSTNFAVGVELAKGWVDYRFEFGECEIGKLTGLNWKDGQFDKGAVGWEWGEKPKEFFASMKQVLKKAEDLEKAGAQALQQGMDTAKRTGRAVYSGVKDVASWVSSW